jgi:hypothetical protein
MFIKFLYFGLLLLQAQPSENITFITYFPMKTDFLSKRNMTPCPFDSIKNITEPPKRSKIMKLDFSEDMEEPDEKLFKPRYNVGPFRLSEFDMILVRIYVNLVIFIYLLMQIAGNIKK